MPKIRNIIKDFRFEESAGVRHCDVNRDHEIRRGERHFAYEEVPGQRLNICMSCAPSVLRRARDHLSDIINELQRS